MTNLLKVLINKKSLNVLTYILLLLLIWSTMWSLFGKEALPPNGYLFNLILIFVLSYIFGQIFSIIHMPTLLGMLITGFLISNTYDINLNKRLSSTLRSIALVIILLRAGLQLDPKAIVKLSAVCFRLSFTPCLVEAITVALVSKLLLDFTFVWGLLLGFVLAAVSPAVVVPGMISLQEKGYGVDKGVPTLVIAAASVDDVLAITGFGLCLGLVFDTNSSLVWSVMKGPVEAIIGITYGIIMGFILWYIPVKEDSKSLRISLLLLCGVFALFGSISMDLGGAGPLACLVVSFVAAIKWRQSDTTNEDMESILKVFWLIFQPFLFALIGTEVSLSAMKSDAIGWALITLAIGLTTRTVTAMLVVFSCDLTLKERLFIGFSWLPKATVQAAIGPIALDMARDKADQSSIETANLVLTIAVLSILITAPVGAIAIAFLGPKCLNKNTKTDLTLELNDKKNDETNQEVSEIMITS
ncbi:sodium/hydrogen exchanger 9B2-like [Oppia nitens]|uniref:sodium/hydrogen exchanger 9B2-like n=1 Tax=Oppia nitens TaxID=1686743 RepID=UPI0023DA8030|nr:sodium/hydrogen exchanger 9B2-like [Oppia nitens]